MQSYKYEFSHPVILNIHTVLTHSHWLSDSASAAKRKTETVTEPSAGFHAPSVLLKFSNIDCCIISAPRPNASTPSNIHTHRSHSRPRSGEQLTLEYILNLSISKFQVPWSPVMYSKSTTSGDIELWRFSGASKSDAVPTIISSASYNDFHQQRRGRTAIMDTAV
ncbi:hypothetical protein BDN71DRAFT_1499000 [Pleurotus eryngii]|uniref:Uncharacterized protein n=1 Tax=Pleurotus eryngii TaxID=5323 RepID=A0A9P5ZKQ1_PLEER|nr:hypothetical protein BDN71DRAFT_1499000 [Pleurotus eryngii]